METINGLPPPHTHTHVRVVLLGQSRRNTSSHISGSIRLALMQRNPRSGLKNAYAPVNEKVGNFTQIARSATEVCNQSPHCTSFLLVTEISLVFNPTNWTVTSQNFFFCLLWKELRMTTAVCGRKWRELLTIHRMWFFIFSIIFVWNLF